MTSVRRLALPGAVLGATISAALLGPFAGAGGAAAPPAVQPATVQPAAVQPPAGLQVGVPAGRASVSSAQVYRLPGEPGMHVAGELRNTGNETVAIVPRAVFRAADGTVVATVVGTYPAVTDLAVEPGSTTAFDIGTDAATAATVTVTVADASPYLDLPPLGRDGRTGYAPQSTALTASPAIVTDDPADTAHPLGTAIGTVTNISPRPLTDVVVQVVGRDVDGRPLRAVVVPVGRLAAGAASTWSRPPTSGAPAAVSVTAVATGFESDALRTALTAQFDPAAYTAGWLLARLTLRSAPGTGAPRGAVPGAVLAVTRRGLTGPAVEVTRVRTDARGTAAAMLPLVGGSYYSFAYAGDRSHAPALFPDSVVGTPPTVAAVPPGAVRAGEPLLVTIRVTGGRVGDRVTVRRTGSDPASFLAAGRLTAAGTARLRVLLAHAGRVSLTPSVDGSTAHPGAVGRALVVTVTP